jgi:3-dehydrosphinganine reductase
MDLNDKTIYVVGGSSGIGLAAAKLFAEGGAHVCLFARNQERLKDARQRVAGRAPSPEQRFASYSVDAADHRQADRIMKRALKEFGTPDILVNCAGQATPRRFEEVTYEQFDETMKINVYATRNAIAALLPAMKKKDGAAIVTVSSIAGYVGVFGYTDYNASKFAVLGFSEALRAELVEYGIKLFVLCPPDTDTPGLAVENQTKPPETRALTAKASLMTPEAVAGALIAGMDKDKFIILPGFDGKFTVLAQRLIPGIVRWVVDRTVKDVQKKLRKLKA